MATRRRRSRPPGPLTHAARVVALPYRVKARFEEFLRPGARVAGACGLAMLAACAVLAGTPPERWPGALDPDRLAVYAVVSLAVASMLGWAFAHEGQKRIRKAVGDRVALAAFVVLPIAFAIVGLVGAQRIAAAGGPPPEHWTWSVVHWYGPTLAVLSLAAFLSWKSRGRTGRGAWFALLVAPYALLLACLVFGFRVVALDDAHADTLRALGSWAVALQLALGFFVGGE